MSKLAIDGGTKVRETPFPARKLIGPEERAAALALFDQAIASGNAFGYGGPPEQQYDKDFAAYLGGGFADAVNSGSNAVYCALGALQLDALSEVIVPPITDCGGIMPVALLGLVPVVADADARSYNTCAEEIEPLITERTRAIVVAHIAGDAVAMDPVLALARKHNLYVVEDCAQAHGTLYKGRLAGTLGDIAAFSTMFGKHHCTGGQGGVVFTRDETLHWQGKRFADRGKPFNLTGVGGNVVAGLNCNLNDLSAVIGSAQVRKLPQIIANRVRVGNAVRAALQDQPAVQVGWQVAESQSSYWFLRMVVRPQALRVDKNTFCQALAAEGIPVSASYRAIPAEYPWFRERKVFGNSGFPWTCSDYRGPREPQARISQAIQAVERHFNIAIHESYGDREVDDIVAAVCKVAGAYAA
jgi:dTDP-4-amino-4,6-dideoxygalactose transaminase